jgi:hypothetical protein
MSRSYNWIQSWKLFQRVALTGLWPFNVGPWTTPSIFREAAKFSLQTLSNPSPRIINLIQRALGSMPSILQASNSCKNLSVRYQALCLTPADHRFQ